jgi:hypothetical protein
MKKENVVGRFSAPNFWKLPFHENHY